jgi:two-component system CheB/CheR fusion protein
LDRLDKQLLSVKRYGGHVVVAFLDFDNFKAINDTYGHDVGDELIKQVGSRLSQVVRGDETIARLGGDEFLLIAMFKNDLSGLSQLLSRIQGTQQQPFFIDNRKFDVKYSIGVGVSPLDGVTSQDLVKAADVAMYQAKRKGSGYCCFYSEETEDLHCK